jgi:prepilin-type N-terminal cleavage/methylation domain-containing protein
MVKDIPNKNSRGFTLIELLVVIAIIGVLSSVVLASLDQARKESRDARRLMDFKQLKIAFELYYTDNLKYPTCPDLFIDNQVNCLAIALTPKYIPSLPTDPKNGGDGNAVWGDYQYYEAGKRYALRAVLEGAGTQRTGSYPSGTTCPSSSYPTCSWYGDCVYVSGTGCSVLVLQQGVK